MRHLSLLAALIVLGCGGGAKPSAPAPAPAAAAPVPRSESTAARPTPPPPALAPAAPAWRIAPEWPLARRLTAFPATQAVVVTSHPIASEVGADVLRRGGNAVDAAVAVGFALAVVHPVAGNIGGGGFMLIRMRNAPVRALDYRETAPRGATATMFVDSAGHPSASSLTGPLSVGVPGSVAGLFLAHQALGRLPWAELLAPAEALASGGYLIDAARSRMITLEAARLAQFPASRTQFLPGDEPPAPGTRFTQPDLAQTLRLIADSGAAVFYHGSIAAAIVREVQGGGGVLTAEDLAGYRPIWRTPLAVSYRGDTIYTMPPPSGGGVALAEILNVMEGYTPPPFGSAALMHLEIEAMRRAYLDRNTYLGDPAFVSMPLARLLSKGYAAQLRAGIDPDRATPSPRPVGVRSEGTETTHYSIVDGDGDAVSCTTTLNNDFGSAVTVSGAGFLLNDEMDDFTTAPGRPNLFGLVQGAANSIAPGKRMLSAMTPVLAVDSLGQLFLVLGSPGGSRITTAVYQVLTNIIDQGMTLADAVAAPRLHHQALPDVVSLERDGFLPAVVDSLEAMGYAVSTWGYKTEVNAIARTPGGWVGVADPRRGGGAAGD